MISYSELKPYLNHNKPNENISIHTKETTYVGQVHKFIVINGEIILLTIIDYKSKEQVTIPGEHINSIKPCANVPE